MSEITTRDNGEIVISYNKEKCDYGWYKDGHDAILNLGTMKKAVVVRKTLLGSGYFVSTGSYFPFSNSDYERRFKTLEEGVLFANNVVKKWLQQTYNNLLS